MDGEPPIAVPLDRYDRPATAVLVNFGIVAGREPTAREVEELGRMLLAEVPRVTIRREHRLELGGEVDLSIDDVIVEVPDDVADGHHPLVLQARLVELASAWARACADDPGDPQTLAERLARQAVIDERAAELDNGQAERL